MNLLLTGASGFLGRNLLLGIPANWRVVALYSRDTSFPEFVGSLGHRDIVAARCDLQNRGEVEAFAETYGREWDACLNLAAKVDIPWSVLEPWPDLVANASPLIHLLDAVRVDRFVHFSSGAVYDGHTGEVGPDAPVAPTLPYAISKLASERYLAFFHQRRGAVQRFVIVRFFGAFGPYERPHKIYTRLVRAFGIDRAPAYTIYGDGTNLIDAMYVDDAVDAMLRMLGGSHWNLTVNLAGGQPMSVEALVRKAASAFEVQEVAITKVGVANEKNLFWGSAREMADLYGFRPATPLADGLRRLHQFLRGDARD